MKWITPLGFLGLATILVLILIYILKPNYQQKAVSSTYIWKLSLRYKRKRLPISKLRNILLLICQILILTVCALLLAQPYLSADDADLRNEQIIILDGSASMQCRHDGTTRFERAVEAIDKLSRDTINGGSRVTLIYADTTPQVLFERAGAADLIALREKLSELKATDSVSDIEAAVRRSETVLAQNPYAEVKLYTGTKYLHSDLVRVMDMSVDGEYNAAILDIATRNDENSYVFDVTVAAYGKPATVTLDLEVSGVNRLSDDGGEGKTVHFRREVTQLRDGEKRMVSIDTREEDEIVYTYDTLYARIEGGDDFSADDRYYLYGGEKPTVRIQYASGADADGLGGLSIFFHGALDTIAKTNKNNWNVEIKEVNMNAGQAPETSGFDMYIFEHKMPESLPTDGVTLLVDPDSVPDGADFRLGERVEGVFALGLGRPHDITARIDATNINITRYTRATPLGAYDELMYCGGDPIFFAKNEPNAKLAVLTFATERSTLGIRPEFSLMMVDFFRYYFPPTVAKNVYEVGDTVQLHARSDMLEVSAPDGSRVFEQFPAEIEAVRGSYTLTQRLLSGQPQTDSFFVKIPAAESNITRTEESLVTPIVGEQSKWQDVDLAVWFALALMILIMAEWLLYSRNPA